MSDLLLRAYHRLPAPLRNAAATARGMYLHSWRYGPETRDLAAAAVARESWTRSQWSSWQQERLARILDRAARQVPYFRRQWETRRQKGDRASWDRLENWPVLEKDAVRRDPRAFVAGDKSTRRMFHEHTSGTTGKPLDLWWSKDTVRAWYGLFEARCRGWYGLSRHHRWANIGGQVVTPFIQTKPPFWVWNRALNQLYMSSYHLSSELIPYYLDAIAEYRIQYLWGYSSSLYALAMEALRRGRRDIALTATITNAEPLFPRQKEVISRAFQCPVRETYGMAEIVAAASECEAGALHLWPEVGTVEVLAEGGSVEPGESGELVCTGLLNPDMPLIRYRTGDRGAVAPPGSTCSCSRSLPLLAGVEGRSDDALYTRDGRRIGRLDPVFKERLPVHEAQIIQESLGRIQVRYVPSADFTESAGQSIVERIRSRMGDVEVVLTAVAHIPREPNGKFRAVICNIPKPN